MRSGPEDGQTSAVDWNFDTNPRHGNDAFEQLFSFFDQEYYSIKAFLIDEQLGFIFCLEKFDQRFNLIESGFWSAKGFLEFFSLGSNYQTDFYKELLCGLSLISGLRKITYDRHTNTTYDIFTKENLFDFFFDKNKITCLK